MALTVLAAYDIQEDGRRSRVAATLQRWGDRIQYSVFICTLTAEDLEAMVAQVEDIIRPETDSFLVLRQCANCWKDKRVLGQAEPPSPVLYWAVL